MSYEPVIPIRLRSLFDTVCDDLATPEQFAELEAILRADEEARRHYLIYCRLHINLHFAVRGKRLLDQIGDSLANDGGTKTPAGKKLPLIGSPSDEQSVKSPVLGFLGGVVDYVNHSRRLMFLLIAVALCGWFVFQIGSVLLGRWFAGNANVADQGGEHPGAPARKPQDGGLAAGTGPLHGKALAWVSGSLGGRWQIVAAKSNAGNHADAEFWEIGTEFTAGQQVNLVAGLGEITFGSGAKVVVSAPAHFSVTSALGADLQLGKLSARVPHDSSHRGATGFTVSTPAGRVVDVGTEFGVEVTPDHKLDVQVFVGEVKVATSSGSGDQTAGPEVNVTAGKTIHVEPGKPASVVDSQGKSRFQRDLTIDSDSRDKQSAVYLDFVRQLKPVVWFRMEGKEGDRILHDEMGRAADAKLHWDGPGNPFVNGRIGKGIWLRGTKLADYAVVPDYPQADRQKFTVSAWAYADSEEQISTIVCNWGDTNGIGQFWIGRHDRHLDGLITRRDGQYVAIYQILYPFPLHEWQHVALVTDGSKAHLYLQGRELMAVEHDGLQYPVRLKALGIGMRPGDAGDAPSRVSPALWSGQVDEILIFNEALTAEEIQKLAAAPPR